MVRGETMDDKRATRLCESPPLADLMPAEGPAPPMYLILLRGGTPGTMLRLSPGGTTLGRSTDNSLQFPENSISRHHAFLGIEDGGVARLTDLGSTNGTFVNGHRIGPHGPVVLCDGDRVRLGASVVVKFVRPDPCE